MSRSPNLIYVFADQLRYQSCGIAGDAKAQTPHLDRLAEQGMNFRQCVSNSPMCAPYRASLFTGKYSSSTGMVINELRLNPNHRCLGHVLHEGGYQTAYIGKWHLWANQLGHHDEAKNSHIPRGPHRLGFDGYWAAYNFHHNYFDQYYYEESPDRIDLPGYEPDGQTQMAIDWVQNHARDDKPFALFLSYGTPHDPWSPANVPQEWLDRFADTSFALPDNYLPQNDPKADSWAQLNQGQRQRLTSWMRVYYAMTANLDWNLGRLLDAVHHQQLEDNTIFVFTSDHGEMFGAHGRRAKNIFYEEAIRVPLVMRWPGRIPAGATSDVCIGTPDLYPTLCGLMGLPTPDEVEGTDLSHCAHGEGGPEPSEAMLQGMGCTADWMDGYEWRAVRDKQFIYAIYRTDRCELLFDHVNDPLQLNNLVDVLEHRTKLEQMRSHLAARMAELNDTFEVCTWYRGHWTQDRCILRTATTQELSRHEY